MMIPGGPAQLSSSLEMVGFGGPGTRPGDAEAGGQPRGLSWSSTVP